MFEDVWGFFELKPQTCCSNYSGQSRLVSQSAAQKACIAVPVKVSNPASVMQSAILFSNRQHSSQRHTNYRKVV